MSARGATGGSARGSRRRSNAKVEATKEATKAVENPVDNAVAQEETMADQKSTANGEVADSKAGKLDLAKKPESGANGNSEAGLVVRSEASDKGELQPAGFLGDRPIAQNEFEIAELFSEAGLRPIGASNLSVFSTILNDRPIVATNLRVVEYVGSRPIFASDVIVRDDLTLPGGRPIVASDPHLLEASLLPGGRPIASNEIDDPIALMGYLD